jgi:hypothetical protein
MSCRAKSYGAVRILDHMADPNVAAKDKCQLRYLLMSCRMVIKC